MLGTDKLDGFMVNAILRLTYHSSVSGVFDWYSTWSCISDSKQIFYCHQNCVDG